MYEIFFYCKVVFLKQEDHFFKKFMTYDNINYASVLRLNVFISYKLTASSCYLFFSIFLINI